MLEGVWKGVKIAQFEDFQDNFDVLFNFLLKGFLLNLELSLYEKSFV